MQRTRARGFLLASTSDGSQTRSFCYVSDEIDGIYRLMMPDYTLPVNIGNPEGYTILEFAKIIIGMTGSGSKITFKEETIGYFREILRGLNELKKTTKFMGL